MELEEKARQKARCYDRKYSEDFTMADMLSRPQDFNKLSIEDVYLCLKEKHYRDGYIDGFAEDKKEKQVIIDTQTVQIESRDVYLAEKENIILRQQSEIEQLKKQIDCYKALDSHYEEIEEDSKAIAEENKQLKFRLKKAKEMLPAYLSEKV